MRVFLAFCAFILVAGCEPNPGKIIETKIWDVYTDMIYETHESFLANMESRHPAEHRMVSWLKQNDTNAYDRYISILASTRIEDGKQVVLKPDCYFLEGSEKPLNQSGLLEIYKKSSTGPLPALSPHSVAIGLIEALANGSIGQVENIVAGELAGKLASHDMEKRHWSEIAGENFYARSVVRNVNMSKSLKEARINLELVFFSKQDRPDDPVEIVTRKMGFRAGLSEDGRWLITEQF